MLVLCLKPSETVRMMFPSGCETVFTLLEVNDSDVVGELLLLGGLTIEANISKQKPLIVCLGDVECEIVVAKFRAGKAEIGFDGDELIEIQRDRASLAV